MCPIEGSDCQWKSGTRSSWNLLDIGYYLKVTSFVFLHFLLSILRFYYY